MGSIEKSGCISVAGIAEAKNALAALDLEIQKRILPGAPGLAFETWDGSHDTDSQQPGTAPTPSLAGCPRSRF